MKTNYKRIPFDLELAKKIMNKEAKGRIISRSGHQARIICFDKDGWQSNYPIVALIQTEPTEESMYTFSKEGAYSIGNEFCRDLMIEVPTYYRDYSNFEPQKWQPCLVRDSVDDKWQIRVVWGKDAYGNIRFFRADALAGQVKWSHILPLSKVTERLIGTTKSYEELIQQLDNEQGKD